jgi:hypothetical protein
MKLDNNGQHSAVCEICEYATFLPDSENLLCSKMGVVAADYSCRRFLYDPLKRIPTPAAKLPKFSAEDFLLD